jgi:hypothetical protein
MANANVWSVFFFVGPYKGSTHTCELVVRPDGTSHWGTEKRRACSADWAGVFNAISQNPQGVKIEFVATTGSPYESRDHKLDALKVAHNAAKKAAEEISGGPVPVGPAVPALDPGALAAAMAAAMGPMIAQAVADAVAASKGRK